MLMHVKGLTGKIYLRSYQSYICHVLLGLVLCIRRVFYGIYGSDTPSSLSSTAVYATEPCSRLQEAWQRLSRQARQRANIEDILLL